MSQLQYRLCVLGPPGSGKGTQSAKLCEAFQLDHLSVGDSIREIQRTTEDPLLKAYLNPEHATTAGLQALGFELIERFVVSQKASQRGFILDGVYKTYKYGEYLNDLLNHHGASLDFVILLNVDQAEAISTCHQRLQNRLVHPGSGRIYNLESKPPITPGVDDLTGEPLERRSEDSTEESKQLGRINHFYDTWKSIAPLFVNNKQITLLEVDGSGDIDEVYTQILAALNNPDNVERMNKKRQAESQNTPPPHPKVSTLKSDVNLQGICYPVEPCEEAYRIFEVLKQSVGGRKNLFPGTQIATLDRKSLPTLNEYNYMVAPKGDGVRYMMLVYHDQVYLINRKSDVFKVDAEVNKVNYLDLCLDGELILNKDRSTLTFIIFDITYARWSREDPMECGTQFLNRRLEEIHAVVKELTEYGKLPFTVIAQDFVPLKEMDRLLLRLDKYPYENEGLVFMPIHKRYRVGLLQEGFRWKFHDSVDFWVKPHPEKPGEVGMYLNDKEALSFQPDVNFLDSNPTQYLDKLLECFYDVRHGGWKALRVRVDKDRANDVSIYRSTNGVGKKFVENIVSQKELEDYVYKTALPAIAEKNRERQESNPSKSHGGGKYSNKPYENKSYGNKSYGNHGYKSSGNKSYGDKPSYGNKQSDGHKPSYGDKPSYGNKPSYKSHDKPSESKSWRSEGKQDSKPHTSQPQTSSWGSGKTWNN